MAIYLWLQTKLILMEYAIMRTVTQKSYLSRIVKTLNYIQTNLDHELTLEELAKEANFSPFHFHRIFSGMLGESVKELVRRLKLERAAIELQTTSMSILQISINAGYESDMAFSRVFKSKVGILPSEFRRTEHARFPCSSKACIRYVTSGHISSFEPLQIKECKMNIMIKDVNNMKVAYVSHQGPYQECGHAWDKLCSSLATEGLLGGDAKMLGVSYDDPDVIPAEDLRYDACITVPNDFQVIDDIKVQTISGGQYAVTTHIGSYNNLSDTYRKFFGQWLPQSDYESDDKPCFEVYLNDPESTEPEDLVTDIYMPIINVSQQSPAVKENSND